MANHFSAMKRARQTEKRTVRNRANCSQLRTALRSLRESLEKGDKAAAGQTYRRDGVGARQGDPEGRFAREYGFALQVAAVGAAERAEVGAEGCGRVGSRSSAPKGASAFEGLAASLKRCPDTKRNFPASCKGDALIRSPIPPQTFENRCREGIGRAANMFLTLP